MKLTRLLFFLALLILTILSCSISSENTDNAEQDNLPMQSKTIIVDVRTVQEWNNDGHANCTVNYPLDDLNAKIETLRAFEKVIVVCRSGSRAGAAKEILERSGIKYVENRGAWQNITCR